MRSEWNEYGKESFTLAVLEELEKKETQTDAQFGNELAVLLEMWREKQERDAPEG